MKKKAGFYLLLTSFYRNRDCVRLSGGIFVLEYLNKFYF